MKLISTLHRPTSAFWLALAILLPVQWMHVVSNDWFFEPPKPIGDGLDYENLAFHLARGDGFRIDNQNPQWREIYTAQQERYAAHLNAEPRRLLATGRPPLFPTLIAAIYRVADRGPLAFGLVRLISASCLALAGALSALQTSVLIGSLPKWSGNQLSSIPDRESWAAALAVIATIGLAAFNNTLKDYATDFLTEPLALLMMQLLVTVLIVAGGSFVERPRISTMAAAFMVGSLLGLLILTRSIFVAWLPGIWLLWLLNENAAWQTRLLRATLVIGLACCCCAPWWIRNTWVLDAPLPLGTQGPITLLGAYSDSAAGAGGDWKFEPEQRLRQNLRNTPQFRQAIDDTAREVLVARAASQEVRRWIAKNPSRLPQMFASRLVTHWNPYSGRSLIWKMLILLGLAYLAYTRHPKFWWLLGLPILSSLVAMGLYTTGGRFLVPLYGLLFSLAGIGIYTSSFGVLGLFLSHQNSK